jgi:hypothetical protein
MQHLWERGKAYKILVGKPREETTWGNLGGDGRIY